MKKNLFLLVLLFPFVSHSQEASVERSVFNIQTGFLGIWISNDAKISPAVSLRSEIGFDAGISGNYYYPKTNWVLAPVITLEPRVFYNLDERIKRSKSISNNNGNFIGFRISYNPDWFLLSNYDNNNVINQLAVIPKWGIRRSLGKHFNFETGVGLGYRYYFAKSAGLGNNAGEVAVDLHLRIGANF